MDQKAEILQLLVPKVVFAGNTLLLIHAGLAFKNLGFCEMGLSTASLFRPGEELCCDLQSLHEAD